MARKSKFGEIPQPRQTQGVQENYDGLNKSLVRSNNNLARLAGKKETAVVNGKLDNAKQELNNARQIANTNIANARSDTSAKNTALRKDINQRKKAEKDAFNEPYNEKVTKDLSEYYNKEYGPKINPHYKNISNESQLNSRKDFIKKASPNVYDKYYIEKGRHTLGKAFGRGVLKGLATSTASRIGFGSAAGQVKSIIDDKQRQKANRLFGLADEKWNDYKESEQNQIDDINKIAQEDLDARSQPNKEESTKINNAINEKYNQEYRQGRSENEKAFKDTIKPYREDSRNAMIKYKETEKNLKADIEKIAQVTNGKIGNIGVLSDVYNHVEKGTLDQLSPYVREAWESLSEKARKRILDKMKLAGEYRNQIFETYRGGKD